MTFKKAEKSQSKLRLGIVGPSGSGKTYSALLIAAGLGGKVAVIDTEHNSAALYADKFNFEVAPLDPPYTPDRYISLLREAEEAGYTVIILDSITHAWAGEGGLLDIHDKVSQASASKNTYMAWRTVTPMHNKFIEAMLSSPCHIIATIRAKQDYALITDSNGKTQVRKLGLAPIQREGMDYEFTTVFDISIEHIATASKDRTSLFDTPDVGSMPFKVGKDTGEKLKVWLTSGIVPPVKEPETPPIEDVPDSFDTPVPPTDTDLGLEEVHTGNAYNDLKVELMAYCKARKLEPPVLLEEITAFIDANNQTVKGVKSFNDLKKDGKLANVALGKLRAIKKKIKKAAGAK